MNVTYSHPPLHSQSHSLSWDPQALSVLLAQSVLHKLLQSLTDLRSAELEKTTKLIVLRTNQTAKAHHFNSSTLAKMGLY